jgi:tetratricopeptide (TPR) repeat protein
VQRLLDDLTARLRAFVRQRDDLALVVRCRDDETVLVAKALEGIEDASDAEMFWLITDEFHDSASYVSGVVNAFAVKHGAVRLAMPEHGMRPWPLLPEALLDETRPPVERLRELMTFSRALLPAPEGFLSVWCLTPLAVADGAAYAELVAALLHHDFPLPWCHHLRILVRGDAYDSSLAERVGPMPRVAWYDPDLSQAAVQRAIDDEAADPALPLARRLQNLFMSAHVDYAHGRFDEALEKHGVLLTYYASTQDATMSALVLNAVGETHSRLGNAEQAGTCFELAFGAATQSAAPPVPVMLNVVLNLANLRLAQERWEAAEACYDSAQWLATAQRDAATKLGALENLGHCQYMQGKTADALTTWHAGAAVARELEMADVRRRLLERLASHYRNVADHARHGHVQHELALLPPATAAA